jgi:hypothetical protein
MNAILQCLLNIDAFSNDLVSKNKCLNENLPQSCLYKYCSGFKEIEISHRLTIS